MLLIGAKAEAYRRFFPAVAHHPQPVAILMGAFALLALLRAQPRAMSALLAVGAGIWLIHTSLLLGLGTIFGGYFLLMTVCVAIGTLVKLNYQSRTRRRRRLLVR